MEEVAAATLPASLGYEWTGTALEEKSAGGQSAIIFGLGLLMAFLVLAAYWDPSGLPVAANALIALS